MTGVHSVEVRDKKGKPSKARLELRYKRIQVLPPIGKHKRYPPLTLTVLYAQEAGTPKGRSPINWKLLTNLPVKTRKEAIEKLEWYALRWKIETFYKILKSGCKAEESRLRTAERLVNMIAVFCILSWRIFWISMAGRVAPKCAPSVAFTKLELQLLDSLVEIHDLEREPGISDYVLKLAMLGGYLARSGDPPPGNTVVWRGLGRLTDIELGFELRGELVGNR